MKRAVHFLLPLACVVLTGCELFNFFPRSKHSKTDVASSHKGGPSAEVTIGILSLKLRDEFDGKPPAKAHGPYEEFWKDRMQYIARHESKEYYDRVFRDFNSSRVKLGLPPITVPSYESWKVEVEE